MSIKTSGLNSLLYVSFTGHNFPLVVVVEFKYPYANGEMLCKAKCLIFSGKWRVK